MQVVCKPGSIKSHKKFEGEVYVLTKHEGGRHTPFFSNYKPQFFFRTADITGGHMPMHMHVHVQVAMLHVVVDRPTCSQHKFLTINHAAALCCLLHTPPLLGYLEKLSLYSMQTCSNILSRVHQLVMLLLEH